MARGASIASRALSWGLSSVILLGTAEIVVRLVDPRPRIQIFDERALPMTVHDGLPFWRLEPENATLYEDFDCAGPGRRQVVLSGDSVFFLVPGLKAEDNVVSVIRRALADLPDVCVHNVSQPGYGVPHQLVAAAEADARLGTDVLVMQVYKRDADFRQIGHRWYDVGPYERDAAGLPRLPGVGEHLPAWWSQTLFEGSALWRYVVLTFGEEAPESGEAYHEVLARAVAAGKPVIFVETPPMDQPFAVTYADRAAWKLRLQAAAEAAGMRYLVLSAMWRDQRPEDVASDTCCHLAAAGHAQLGEALAAQLREVLPPPRPALPSR